MIFTFLSITYNHEKFIAQHLESIKNQIVQYGQDIKFQLIISDDCSSDSTINIVGNWLKDNGSLFDYLDILESNANRGTCKNYTKGIRKIKGDYYKSLAGDDIYAKENIFKAIKLLGTFDIICTPVAPFLGEELYIDNKIFSRVFEMYKFCNTDYRTIQKNFISVPMTPGVFMRKELITEDVIEFINQYTLIEDRSCNIKIYEQNNMLKIGYYEKILVLYRHHENAVTKTKNKNINIIFKDDSTKLYEYVRSNTDNYFLKSKITYNIFLDKVKNRKLALLLNLEVLLYRIIFILNYYKYKYRIKNIIEKSFMPNKKHLSKIIEEAQKYEYEPSNEFYKNRS